MKTILIMALGLAACATTPEPAVEIRTVEVPVEVLKPCPAVRPARPEGIGKLSPDLAQLVAQLGAKLKEYSGEGGYADRAEAYFDACPNEPPQS